MKYLSLIILTVAALNSYGQLQLDSVKAILNQQYNKKIFCEKDDDGYSDYQGEREVINMIRDKVRTVKINPIYKDNDFDFNIYGKVNCRGEFSLKYQNVIDDQAQLDYLLKVAAVLDGIKYPKAKRDFKFTYIEVIYRKGVLRFQ